MMMLKEELVLEDDKSWRMERVKRNYENLDLLLSIHHWILSAHSFDLKLTAECFMLLVNFTRQITLIK